MLKYEGFLPILESLYGDRSLGQFIQLYSKMTFTVIKNSTNNRFSFISNS